MNDFDRGKRSSGLNGQNDLFLSRFEFQGSRALAHVDAVISKIDAIGSEAEAAIRKGRYVDCSPLQAVLFDVAPEFHSSFHPEEICALHPIDVAAFIHEVNRQVLLPRNHIHFINYDYDLSVRTVDAFVMSSSRNNREYIYLNRKPLHLREIAVSLESGLVGLGFALNEWGFFDREEARENGLKNFEILNHLYEDRDRLKKRHPSMEKYVVPLLSALVERLRTVAVEEVDPFDIPPEHKGDVKKVPFDAEIYAKLYSIRSLRYRQLQAARNNVFVELQDGGDEKLPDYSIRHAYTIVRPDRNISEFLITAPHDEYHPKLTQLLNIERINEFGAELGGVAEEVRRYFDENRNELGEIAILHYLFWTCYESVEATLAGRNHFKKFEGLEFSPAKHLFPRFDMLTDTTNPNWVSEVFDGTPSVAMNLSDHLYRREFIAEDERRSLVSETN